MKKTEKITKFNLYMSCVLLVVFLLMLIATTIAYFTDHVKISNTMTTGNVKITLSEAAVKLENGNLVKDESKDRVFGTEDDFVHDYGVIYPGQKIFKDPTIENVGSNDAWVAAKVTIYDGRGDLRELMGYEGYDEIDIGVLLTGSSEYQSLLSQTVSYSDWNGLEDVMQNENFAMVQVANPAEDKYEFYFIVSEPLTAGETVTLFDHMEFDSEWTNTDMQHFAELEVEIMAFAVQTFDLNSCYEAMTKAFPTHFSFNTNSN